MSFSQRIGAVTQKPIQVDSMDNTLRNRLYNVLNDVFPKQRYYSSYDQMREFVLDKLGFNVEASSNSSFSEEFHEVDWYRVYDILEFVVEYIEQLAKTQYGYYNAIDYRRSFNTEISKVLEEEKSGYRLFEDRFVPIANSNELESLEESIKTDYQSVAIHIKKAIGLYSSRESPDYENSIKESISAVEALCCIITETKSSQATLGNTLKKLEECGFEIHPALRDAFSKIYGYTSDEEGIRHGSIDFKMHLQKTQSTC